MEEMKMLTPIVYNSRLGYGDFCGYAPRDLECDRPWDVFILVRWDNTGKVTRIDLDECELIESWFDMVCA